MYKLEFGEELFITIYYLQKIFRDLDLTCIKEFCDPTMILEKEKCTSGFTLRLHKKEEKHLTLLSSLTLFCGSGRKCFSK